MSTGASVGPSGGRNAGDLTVPGKRSAGVIGTYVVLAALIVYFSYAENAFTTSPWPSYLLLAICVFFLARYLSTIYQLDATRLRAWRILGTRTIRFEDVRKIEYANLRDLGPVGMFASWGYRGRMWSPVLGAFDAIYTESLGLLVTADKVPLFISPRDPAAFARELSRRVRSYTGPLEVDVGAAPPPVSTGGF